MQGHVGTLTWSSRRYKGSGAGMMVQFRVNVTQRIYEVGCSQGPNMSIRGKNNHVFKNQHNFVNIWNFYSRFFLNRKYSSRYVHCTCFWWFQITRDTPYPSLNMGDTLIRCLTADPYHRFGSGFTGSSPYSTEGRMCLRWSEIIKKHVQWMTFSFLQKPSRAI